MVGDLQAQYCVKMTGVFEGKMGTKRWKKYSAVQLSILENTFTFRCQKGKRLKIAKSNRFCSSRDWGRYCEYIKRPGDIQVDFHDDLTIVGGAGDQSLLCSLFTVELTGWFD